MAHVMPAATSTPLSQSQKNDEQKQKTAAADKKFQNDILDRLEYLRNEYDELDQSEESLLELLESIERDEENLVQALDEISFGNNNPLHQDAANATIASAPTPTTVPEPSGLEHQTMKPPPQRIGGIPTGSHPSRPSITSLPSQPVETTATATVTATEGTTASTVAGSTATATATATATSTSTATAIAAGVPAKGTAAVSVSAKRQKRSRGTSRLPLRLPALQLPNANATTNPKHHNSQHLETNRHAQLREQRVLARRKLEEALFADDDDDDSSSSSS